MNSTPPTGTVTFLFTDIEGSTRLARDFPAAWPVAKARHHAILRETTEAHHGYVFQEIGDALCVAFATAPDALAAAVAAQRALYVEPWGETGAIHVRMGLHTGEAREHERAYDGYLTLSRVQRIMSVAQGGQVLLSQACSDLVRERLPANLTLRDLGEQRLKDFALTEHLYQLVAPDLPASFPTLKTHITERHNLPAQLSSFIGRQNELSEVRQLLEKTRLLTLTGAGGCGKTRLAQQTATTLVENYADGVWFVALAALDDAALIPQAVVTVLGIGEQPGRALDDSLRDYLRAKHALLLLDNCEHLVSACAQLAESLLQTCPALSILATSREALNIAGESTYLVPSLTLPVQSGPHTYASRLLGAVEGSEAVQLFVVRARAAQPHFQLTAANAHAVTQICRRLDGIPLAIELAAVRVKALSVERVAARLDDAFHLLASGSRTALPRHQTLHATIEWSYNLLSGSERVLLRRLAVFMGGWTLEAAEAVCADEDGEAGRATLPRSAVFDVHAHLVDKSLVIGEEHGDDFRYRMLETIRQYASEKLAEAGEDRSLSVRHQAYYLSLAQAAEPNLRGADQARWFRRLESERPNLRAAIERSRGSDETGKALQLVSALVFFWNVLGYHREGAELGRDVLSRPESHAPTLARANVLASTGLLLWGQGNQIEAYALATQGLSISDALGDQSAIALSLWALGLIAMSQGDFDAAGEHLRRCLAISRESGYLHRVGDTLNNLGILAIYAGDLQGARAYCEETVRIYRGLGDRPFLAFALRWLAHVVAHDGDVDRAVSLLKECMTLAQEWGGKRGIAAALAGLAATSALRGDSLRAVRLFGAAEAILEQMLTDLLPQEKELVNQNIVTLRANLDTDVFNRAWAEGRALTMEQAIALALSVDADPA